MKFRPTIFLFVACLLLWSCDKVQENPRPVFLEEDEPEHIEIDMAGNDSVSFQLFDMSILDKQITVTVRQPVHGTISPSGVSGTFVYTPTTGFTGNDSLIYMYCMGTECKEAKVSFQVFPPCQFSLNPDFFSFPDRATDLLRLHVLSNDVLDQCTSSVITKAWSAQAQSISWSNDAIEILLQPFATGKVNISYEVCGTFNRCKTADVVVETNPRNEYCEANFNTKNDTLTLPNGFYFRVFQPADLLQNDGYCVGKINLSSFAINRFPSANGPGKLVFQNDAWWYLVNNPQNFVSDDFTYSICTQAGKCDTATVTITKNW